jgi:hypothetical protein
MAKFTPTIPRLKASPMQSNPEVSIGIGEKGGISLYIRGQRFPVSLYFDQWQLIFDEELIAEFMGFAEDHKELLADGKPKAVPKDVEDRTYTINANEVALAEAESKRLIAEGDMTGALKYATIKSVAEANKGKVSFEALNEIMQLKARK